MIHFNTIITLPNQMNSIPPELINSILLYLSNTEIQLCLNTSTIFNVLPTKIMNDLIEQLDEIGITNEYKSIIADDLIKEAINKLKEEKFIGTISGEIVTVAIHDFCKVNLGLSDSNIELFIKALEGDYLGNVGPQVKNGTEFTLNRWNKYIQCVGSKRQ